ncbi:TetR/AcrR family transcriptional regulator [Umezawaea endophytica]|uniref:TetR/AcrR family transcriptional regulator n=1 Tax=Umezawaea endophytica TaxID=1654476 RepID=A0A9X2VWI5_9PSEU|nr:TetR/AcrR family transcriptional regulator [Umezawaea endophytica]MCS7483911.1 TetR/AcrR family transcriptional regulator [Umezawaea endophytica]
MSTRTVNWTALQDATPSPEGLRERKKRLMRQQLSDTATEMFIERGFDAVRVSEIAEACGVSEKTVFNYFPTKESLVLDLGEATLNALNDLADPKSPPVETAVRILNEQLQAITTWLSAQENAAEAINKFRQFGTLVAQTPALRAHQRDMTDKLVTAAAQILATRLNQDTNDPEPQIAAVALLGLWQVQFQALRKHLDANQTPEEIAKAVTADVQRAANTINKGLTTLGK